MPPETRAELVGGVVYMPSPVERRPRRARQRRRADGLFHYKRLTPGLRSPEQRRRSSSIDEGEPNRTVSSGFRRSWAARPASMRTVTSPARPSWSSRSPAPAARFDLEQKKADYERAGVLEYLVVELDPIASTGSSAAATASRTCPRSGRDLSLGGLPRLVARCRAPSSPSRRRAAARDQAWRRSQSATHAALVGETSIARHGLGRQAASQRSLSVRSV